MSARDITERMPKAPARAFKVLVRLSPQEKGWLDFVAKKKGLTAQNAIRSVLKETCDSLRRQLAAT